MPVETARRMPGIHTVADLQKATKYAASKRRTELGNSANAQWAGAALAKYGAVVQGEWQEPIETVFGDLLQDLIHLADALGIDFEEKLRTAEEDYTTEVDGE